MEFLKEFSKNKNAYNKQTLHEVDGTASNYMKGDFEEIEVGFVDGLFEMCKLRELSSKANEEILSNEMISSYNDRFGTSLFTSNITFRSATIESIIIDTRLELDKQKKIEGPLMIYDCLIIQHVALKCILERKYDTLMNAIIYDKVITKFVKRRYSQYAFAALVRFGMVLANRQFLMAFIVGRNNWRRKTSLIIKNKEEQEKQKLIIN